MRTAERRPTDTGVPVYPKLPVPKAGRESEGKMKLGPAKRIDKVAIGIVGGTLLGGILIGWLLRPRLTTDPRIGEAEEHAAESAKAADAEKTRGDSLQKELDATKAAKAKSEKDLGEAQKAQTELASRVAEAEKVATENAAAQKKLQAVVGTSTGTISADGNEIHLQLVDRILFKTGDDQLTDQGKIVLTKVAQALKELPDKQIWVQGHTDDQPIVIPPAPKTPPAAPPKKGAKPATPATPAAPAPKFATNWELSAGRALTVVHFLQDTAKIDPTRLAALAFGQYHPLKGAPQAANRRIEIVLYPRPDVKK